MNSPPPTETYEIEFPRDERWLVHHVLVSHVDDVLDEEGSPPEWTLRAIDAVEAETTTLTGDAVATLHGLVSDYVDAPETPADEVDRGTAVLERLGPLLEAADD